MAEPVTAVEATQTGMYWAAGFAEYRVLMSDGTSDEVVVPAAHDSRERALGKAEADRADGIVSEL